MRAPYKSSNTFSIGVIQKRVKNYSSTSLFLPWPTLTRSSRFAAQYHQNIFEIVFESWNQNNLSKYVFSNFPFCPLSKVWKNKYHGLVNRLWWFQTMFGHNVHSILHWLTVPMTRTEIDDTEKNLRSHHFLVFDSEECCRGSAWSASLELSE